jgi:hypothetical protein
MTERLLTVAAIFAVAVPLLLLVMLWGTGNLRRRTPKRQRRISQAAAVQAVDRAARLGLVNPQPRRRWSIDRKSQTPVHRVLEDMPHHH